MRLSAGQRGLGFKWSLGLHDGLSFRPFALSLSSLLSCSSLLASVKENLTQHYGDSTPRGDGVVSAMPSYQAFRLPPSSVSYFVPLLPLQSPLPPLPPLAAPDLILHLCVLQPLDTFSDSSPSVGRQRAFQPGGHNAAILTNQWQINQCYLFFPCLCCHRFFFFFFFSLLCYLPRLELCSIKLSSLSGTNCSSMRFSAQRQTLMLAPDGAYKSFIYEMPHSSRSCGGFYWSWTWIYWYCEPSFRWGMLDACFDCQVFHFEPELISKTETKQIPFDHIY